MTTYQGGKKRLGKQIYTVISDVENIITNGEKLPYFEPFVGMGGVLRHFAKENDRDVYACDINKDLILMWKSIQNGWEPPLKCSKKKFKELKESKEHSAERGYLGVVASWGGIFFASYRLGYNKQKDFLGEGYRGIMDIKPDIMSVNFITSKPYDKFVPKGMLIYCDPPYMNNKFNTIFFSNFDHEKFWEVMRDWSKDNIVIISESTAPKDFKKIWSVDSTFVNNHVSKKYQEFLFIHKDLFRKFKD